MQNNSWDKPQTPNTKPVAKRLKKVKSNLALTRDQIRIHRATYEDFLQKMGFSQSTIIDLLKVYDKFITKDEIKELFAYPMKAFHFLFLDYLKQLQ